VCSPNCGLGDLLLFLDQERRLMVGNSRFSYTLNRVNKP
jgi:hypothetical protein